MGRNCEAQEWSDALFLRYGLELPDLPTYCGSCNSKFTICHAPNCKRGGLITARHNELRDGVAGLSGKAFTPTHMHDDPRIFTGRAMRGGKAKGKATGKGKEAPSPEEG